MSINTDILIAGFAAMLAVTGIIYLVIRVVQSLAICRLFAAVRKYPNISMALALAARGSAEDAARFRVWVERAIETHGWEKAEEVTGELLRRVYPLGMMNIETAQPASDNT